MIFVVKAAAPVTQGKDVVALDQMLRPGQMLWWVLHVEQSKIMTVKPYVRIDAKEAKIKFDVRSKHYAGDGTYVIGVGALHQGKRFVVKSVDGKLYLGDYAEELIQRDGLEEVMALIRAENQ